MLKGKCYLGKNDIKYGNIKIATLIMHKGYVFQYPIFNATLIMRGQEYEHVEYDVYVANDGGLSTPNLRITKKTFSNGGDGVLERSSNYGFFKAVASIDDTKVRQIDLYFVTPILANRPSGSGEPTFSWDFKDVVLRGAELEISDGLDYDLSSLTTFDITQNYDYDVIVSADSVPNTLDVNFSLKSRIASLTGYVNLSTPTYSTAVVTFAPKTTKQIYLACPCKYTNGNWGIAIITNTGGGSAFIIASFLNPNASTETHVIGDISQIQFAHTYRMNKDINYFGTSL